MRTLIITTFLLSHGLMAQTFTGSGGAIPNDESVVDFPISVSGLVPATIDTLNFGLEAVCFDISHPNIGDLEVQLVAPNGATALLVSVVGVGSTAFTGTCLDASAATPILSGTAPYTGNFKPQGQIGRVNSGQNPNGTWKLRIKDLYSGSEPWGTLNSSSIRFGTSPATYLRFTSSNLPIVIISTGGQPVPTNPRSEASVRIVDNGPGNINNVTGPFVAYNSFGGIEIRGNTSIGFPKKNYSLEFWDGFGIEQEAPIFGMPQESDWVLGANYADKSGLNNALAFDLGRRMGHYAPRWQHVELVLNGAYVGVYTFAETIKRDADRVDISKLTVDDIAGDSLTGGYILKLADNAPNPSRGWTSLVPPNNSAAGAAIHIEVDYPRSPLPVQLAYIHAYVDSFETALASSEFQDPVIGYRKYIDDASLIDFFLVSEFARSVDSYRTNVYFYKAKITREAKMFMGPLWDFDLGFGNADNCGGNSIQGWQYQYNETCSGSESRVPFWWDRLMQDPQFVIDTHCRWLELRNTVFSTNRLDAWCDSMNTVLAPAMTRNYSVWPTLGTVVPPNPTPVPTTYTGEVQELKAWINARWSWMDANLPGICAVGIQEPVKGTLHVIPNPCTDRFEVRLPSTFGRIERVDVTDAFGRTIPISMVRSQVGIAVVEFLQPPAAGTYIVRLITEDGPFTARFVSEGQAR